MITSLDTTSPRALPTWGKKLADTLWFLVFLVLPLAYLPVPLGATGTGLVSYPPDAHAEFLLPKVLVLAVVWVLGLGLITTSCKCNPRWGFMSLLPLLALFLVSLLLTSFFNEAALNFNIAGLSSRAQNVLAVFAEVMSYSLVAITALTFRLYPSRQPMHLMTIGAGVVSLWTLASAYGLDPTLLFGVEASGNNTATIGHQGFVAAYLGVVLVFWLSWRVLTDHLELPTLAVTALLAAGMVASGGRAGILAAFIFLVLMLVYSVWHRKRVMVILRVLLVLVLSSLTVTLTSSHVAERVEALEQAASGTDLALTHRFLFWELASEAVLDRPWLGHGAGAFSELVWDYANPEQAEALVAEFVPPDLVDVAVLVDDNAIYFDAEEMAFHLVPMKSFKAHNYLLDMALASGLLPMLLFVVFVLLCGWHLYHARTPFSLAAFFALCTYLLYGSVWFATINVDPVVWAIVGLGLASLPMQQAVVKREPSVRTG